MQKYPQNRQYTTKKANFRTTFRVIKIYCREKYLNNKLKKNKNSIVFGAEKVLKTVLLKESLTHKIQNSK